MSEINENTIPSSRTMNSDKTMLRLAAVIPSSDLCQISLAFCKTL
jgi:hypothetical protein